MSRLAYNQVWEDYDVDRAALAIGPADTVLLITSGGCNVLNTLTEEPRRIVTVDANGRQCDLLADKLRIIRDEDHERLWHKYGTPAQQDQRSVYVRGAYARFAWVRAFIRVLCGPTSVRRFVDSSTLTEQRAIYLREIEPRLWNRGTRALPAAVAGICGMHWRQVASTLRFGRFLLESICRDRMRHVLTSFPIRDNYYWYQMLTGAYAGPTQCPPYLQPGNFAKLRALSDRVENHHGDIIAYLRRLPTATFTRANLLDVPEFLSPVRRLALFREIRRVCAPGARIVYRSFAPRVHVPTECNGNSPDGLRPDTALSRQLTLRERTASYGRVHVYTG